MAEVIEEVASLQPSASSTVPDTTTNANNPSPPNSNSASTTTAPPEPRKRRFSFQESYDVVLLRCVTTKAAHIAPWGQKAKLFEEVLDLFLQALPGALFECMQKPNSKTITDRFNRLVAQRREKVKETAAASGVSEAYGEKEQLLDDIILEIDEYVETVNADKEKKTETEKKLVQAGVVIRDLALNRGAGYQKRNRDSMSDENSSNKGVVPSGEELNLSEVMMSEIKRRREHESTQVELSLKRFELEKERTHSEHERVMRIQETNDRKLCIEEKRFELEREERKEAIAERRQMIALMAAMHKGITGDK